jgi:hypothetical protein
MRILLRNLEQYRACSHLIESSPECFELVRQEGWHSPQWGGYIASRIEHEYIVLGSAQTMIRLTNPRWIIEQ